MLGLLNDGDARSYLGQLRENLSAYEPTYVAVAETLETPLLTADARLARAPGPTCPITVVRS